MQRTWVCFSPKLKLNTHPKNVVRWRPGTPGFWKPKYGASKMKWNFVLPYVREIDSLHHYPEVSRISGKPIDWYHEEPDDGYEGARMFGENTLELQGMPLGRTPEYMQERLRRFFSKFGPVKHCRAEPHALDPYQCEGKAWVTFRDKRTAMKALRAPLKFPASLHDKVISMRDLDTDKRNDPDYREKSRFWNGQLIMIARHLHQQLSKDPTLRVEGKPLSRAGDGLLERELVALPAPETPRWRGGVPLSKGLHGAPTRLVSAGSAVLRRFGSWEQFLAEPPFDELFRIDLPADAAEGDSAVADEKASTLAFRSRAVIRPRLVSSTQRARILVKASNVLEKRLHDEFSVWWREGKVQLPDYTARRVMWWDHKPKLPMDIQIQSRSKDLVKIFDEKFLYRMQLRRARNEKRKERRAEWNEERLKQKAKKAEALERRRDAALAAVQPSRRDLSAGLVSPGYEAYSRDA